VPEISATGTYVGASANNAYARSVLDELIPVPADFATASDAYLNALAPFYGTVVSLDPELACYRQHRSNVWRGKVGLEQLRAHLALDTTRERYIQETARRRGRTVPDDLLLRNWYHVFHRLCYLRLAPSEHPYPGDSRLRLALAAAGAIRRSRELAGAERIYYAALVAAIAGAPRPTVERLVLWAMTTKPRPAWLRYGRRALRAISLRRS